MSEKQYFTQASWERRQAKITELQREVAEAGTLVGEEAGINCDWHDNFGFEEAQRQLEQKSRRLKDLVDATLGRKIIEVVEQNEIVAIGTTVRLILVEKATQEETTKIITIGAFGESLPNKNLVSYTAPIVRKVLGKEDGDEAEDVQVGGKIFDIIIDEIHPPSYRYNEIALLLDEE